VILPRHQGRHPFAFVYAQSAVPSCFRSYVQQHNPEHTVLGKFRASVDTSCRTPKSAVNAKASAICATNHSRKHRVRTHLGKCNLPPLRRRKLGTTTRLRTLYIRKSLGRTSIAAAQAASSPCCVLHGYRQLVQHHVPESSTLGKTLKSTINHRSTNKSPRSVSAIPYDASFPKPPNQETSSSSVDCSSYERAATICSHTRKRSRTTPAPRKLRIRKHPARVWIVAPRLPCDNTTRHTRNLPNRKHLVQVSIVAPRLPCDNMHLHPKPLLWERIRGKCGL